MKTAKITLNPPEIKSISYNNTFRQKAGQPLKMTVKSQVSVKTNPAAPTTAMALVKITAGDEEKNLSFEVETMTLAVASTFVDNLDDVLKTQYLPILMMAVNEKIRSVSVAMGLNLRLPNPQLDYRETPEAEAPIVITSQGRPKRNPRRRKLL